MSRNRKNGNGPARFFITEKIIGGQRYTAVCDVEAYCDGGGELVILDGDGNITCDRGIDEEMWTDILKAGRLKKTRRVTVDGRRLEVRLYDLFWDYRLLDAGPGESPCVITRFMPGEKLRKAREDIHLFDARFGEKPEEKPEEKQEEKPEEE